MPLLSPEHGHETVRGGVRAMTGEELRLMSDAIRAELSRRDTERRRTTSPGAMRRILAEVAQERGVAANLILSRTRAHPVAHARQEAFWRCSVRGESLPQIGRFFGRDHTTVLHGVRQHERRLAAR